MDNRVRAIVIGGGIAGKLAARVLSEFYKEVIILERDIEPTGPKPRKGTPQGHHLHALLHAGEYGLEALYPGISDTFHNSGALKIDSTNDLAWFHHGVWKHRYSGEFTTTLQTRPHLEWHLEQYTRKIPNVTFLNNTSVKEYLYDKDEKKIYGVITIHNGISERILGDLIVDTSGVSSFSSKWLKENRIFIPEEKVQIGLSYISRFYQLPELKNRDWTIKLLYPNPPHEKIGGTISKVEQNRYIVTLIGYHNEITEKEVLTKENGFLELTKQLPKQDIYHELCQGTPLSDISIYRVPQINWKHFEQIKNLPDGLILFGDTVCRFDPVFGQGMSIAVLEALALQKMLQKHSSLPMHKRTKSFQQKIVRIIAPAWKMVISEDFRYPESIGNKPFGLSAQQKYVKNIFLQSSYNQNVYSRFIKVMNLVEPATILFHPSVLFSIFKQSFFKLK